MKARILTFSLLISFLCLVNNASAQDNFKNADLLTTETKNEEPVEEEEKTFSVSGFVDAYYQYHFQEQPFPTSFTETHNSFTPGMANVVLSKEGKFGFVADLAVGPRAEVANGYNGTTLAVIKQLYVSYGATDNLTFTLGNFGTHVGYEVIDAPANLNYSTSYMFSNGPFYHTGLKADVSITDNFGFMVGLFNDTDSKIDEVSGKHIGAQISFSSGGLDAYLNYIGGKDDDSVADNEVFGHQIDLTATYEVSDAFAFGLNSTVKTVAPDKGDNTSWFGAALYANYAFNDAFTLALRGEYISDEDGLISGVSENNITSLTLSGNIYLGPITLIPEVRLDTSKEDAFLDDAELPTDKSAAFIFAAVYAF